MPDRSGRGSPCCLIGDSGTGKSHLLIGLGIAAAEAGFRVRYVLAGRLVNELAEAENDRTLTKVIARYGRIDLLCLDELGYLALDRRGRVAVPGPHRKRRTRRHRGALRTNRSAAGQRRSPTHGFAPRSLTDSPSPATSSRPELPATASPTPEPNRPRHDRADPARVGPSQAPS